MSGVHSIRKTGTGQLLVGNSTATQITDPQPVVQITRNRLLFEDTATVVVVFNQAGRTVIRKTQVREVRLNELPAGVYLIQYIVDGRRGVCRTVVY
ncbi:MAG: T9SS type A sorting domain-containing protein [Bacteroidetes bacterium]|nr:MAG: T9SS type A sorting domain-containing protein [Bacteroidota bacterium]